MIARYLLIFFFICLDSKVLSTAQGCLGTNYIFIIFFISVQNTSHRITGKNSGPQLCTPQLTVNAIKSKTVNNKHISMFTLHLTTSKWYCIFFIFSNNVLCWLKWGHNSNKFMKSQTCESLLQYWLNCTGTQRGNMHQLVMLMNWVTHFLSKVNMRNC